MQTVTPVQSSATVAGGATTADASEPGAPHARAP